MRHRKMQISGMLPILICFFISLPALAQMPLSEAQKAKVVQSAVSLGKIIESQGRNDSDLEKILHSDITNSIAEQLHPNKPGDPLGPGYEEVINQLLAETMKQLGKTSSVTPTNVVVPVVTPPDTPPVNPVTPPGPVNPNPPGPRPVQPDQPQPRPNPQPQPEPQPDKPPQPQPRQQVVWVFVPFQPVAPPVVPAYVPQYSVGRAPVIYVHHGWFGHPDTVKYKYGH